MKCAPTRRGGDVVGQRAASLSAPRPDRRDAHDAGTHSDAKSTAARDFPVPRSNLRRPARSSLAVKMLGSFWPRWPNNRSTALSTWVRPYGRTLLPMWQPEQTNWLHGLPDGHLHGAFWQKRPPSRRLERRWPNRSSGPLMDFFLMLPRSRGAIGRVRATPGGLPTAGRSTGGLESARKESPAKERG